MKSGKVILGALVGVAAGAVLGILFAPDQGKTTRKKISKKRDELVDDLEDKFNKVVDTFKKKFDSIQEEVTGLVDDVKGKVTAEKTTPEKK